jgi:hypothetical protein
MRFLPLILLASAAYAVEVPPWIVKGILYTETRSYIKNGQIVYVDTRVGRHVERGPLQMRKVALQTVEPGASVRRLQTDTQFAKACAEKYLSWLYEGPANNNWLRAIAMYNAGPSCRAITSYVRRVQEAAGVIR